MIAATGEDAIVYCPDSDYAANMEKAEALAPRGRARSAAQAAGEDADAGQGTCADVAELLGVPLTDTVKSLVLATDDDAGKAIWSKTHVWLLLLRGDHDMNEIKVGKVEALKGGFRFATLAEIEDALRLQAGLPRPGRRAAPVKVVADREVAVMADWICGANDEDFHFTGVNWGRDLPEPDVVADMRNVVAGDPSPDGKGALAIERGIEVGHVFYLGTKYSQAMNATFLDETGKPQFMEMGCYGIGITRLPAAAIEQNHDERGIIWPDAIAPFTCGALPDRPRTAAPTCEAAAETLYDELLAAGVDVILDDRGERPGAMFADWELIGVPHRIVISDRGLKDGANSSTSIAATASRHEGAARRGRGIRARGRLAV